MEMLQPAEGELVRDTDGGGGIRLTVTSEDLVITPLITNRATCSAITLSPLQTVTFDPFRRIIVAHRMRHGRLHDGARGHGARGVHAGGVKGGRRSSQRRRRHARVVTEDGRLGGMAEEGSARSAGGAGSISCELFGRISLVM
jgi:hypothetical protein